MNLIRFFAFVIMTDIVIAIEIAIAIEIDF